MKRKSLVKNLTKALYTVSEENHALEEVRNAIKSFDQLVNTNSYLRVFLQSKKIAGNQKAEILNDLLDEIGHPLVNEMVSYLNGSTAISDLNSISSLFDSMYKESKNILSVKGTVAENMSKADIESLRSSLNNLLGKETDLSINIDASLIGGIKLRIDNTFLDASIQNQLQNLRSKLMQI